jgi:hypothetical protein
MRVRFARTRYEYESYTDYWALVGLAGFPVCYVDEIRLDEPSLYVVTPINGEFRPHILNERARVGAERRARVVWWNLERPDSGPGRLHNLGRGVCNDLEGILEYADAVWTSDRHLWQFVADEPRYLYLPLGSDLRLAPKPSEVIEPCEWDVCHLSYSTPRRDRIYEELSGRGLTLAPNGWGEDRDRILSRSRLILNVHQTPAPVASPLRFALAAAYRLPLVTETLADPDPLRPGVHCRMADYRRLAAGVAVAVDDPRLAEEGERLHTLLCHEHPFLDSVVAAAHRTVEAIT